MREGRVGKPWTAEEDELLIQAVSVHGESENWKTVALAVPGRTNKACRKRWLHSLSPSIKKTAWTLDEDQLLLTQYAVHGTKWSVIARHIPGRTDDACSKRYREALDPSLRREDWTSEEDALLVEAYGRLGGRWGQVGQELKRSGLGCRNRWRMLERRRAASAARGGPGLSGAYDAPAPAPQDAVQWTPLAAHFWDPAIAPYAPAPAGLPSSSSVTLDAHPSVFVPNVYREHAPFQYSSSSLSRALSSPQISSGSGMHSLDFSIAPISSDYGHQDTVDDFMSMPPGGAAPYETSSEGYMNTDAHMNFHLEAHEEAETNTFDVQPCREGSSGEQGSHTPELLSASHSNPPSVSPSPSIPHSPEQEEHAGPLVEQVADPVQPSAYYRTPTQKLSRPSASATRRDLEPDRPPPRLSSNLPATSDAAVLAYSCGHNSCWPADADRSASSFATSRELAEHSKKHSDDVGSTPFRCGLPGCTKSWKSINGLQYHLQMSKMHFQQALLTLPPAPPVLAPAPAPDAPADGAKQHRVRKTHQCPHADCRKQYKQLSGLRYHIAHGHPAELPAQLDVLPPALMRKMAEKSQAKGPAAG